MANTSGNKAPKSDKTMPHQAWSFNITYILIMLVLLWGWQQYLGVKNLRIIPYSDFKQYVHDGRVTEAIIKETIVEGQLLGVQSSTDTTATDHSQVATFITVRVEDPDLVRDLQKAGVKYVGVRPSFFAKLLTEWLIPIGIMLLLWHFLMGRLGRVGGSVMSFGKSKAKLIGETQTEISFDSVAGCDEAKQDLYEIVDFLKRPEKYTATGATIPKGALLVGPPGTGKTLLAKAVAGEAQVPFFAMSGSDFVEMFVGVGAARVRDLFQQAKSNSPCIIFIDEMDAIGRQRGVHVGAVNDEREQTLNQLLVEMDGFEANSGVIILAATNRPEVLDRALLRPGRFDRQIVVDAPDVHGREAILKVHTKGKPLAADVDLEKIARATPGFSGADLANAVNEAALLASRRKAETITQQDFEKAVERVVAGPERKSRRLNEEEKKRVAYHETGHALVAALSEYANPVHKISIVPRGKAALGYTMQLPADDQYLKTRNELYDEIKCLLGGRAAEEIYFEDVSTGAQNDLERATILARQMVTMYGMSEKIGLAHCAQRQSPYFLATTETGMVRDCSEETAREIDEEVKGILSFCYEESKKILTQKQALFEIIVMELMEKETIDGSDFQKLLEKN